MSVVVCVCVCANMIHLPHVLVILLRDVSDECPTDPVLVVIQSIGCNDVTVHDVTTTMADHTDQHWDILMDRDFVVVADFVWHDEMVVESTAAESPIVMPDDASMVMDRGHYYGRFRYQCDLNQ